MRNYTYFFPALFVLFSGALSAQCTINTTVSSSSNPLGSCTGEVVIADGGVLNLDGDYNISSSGVTSIRIKSGGAISWNGNHSFFLPAGFINLIVESPASPGLTTGSGCDTNQKIFIGGVQVASCNGNPANQSLLSFAQINTAGALPVTWLSFRAALNDGGGVQLSWSTASESNNEGFDIQRSENGQDWRTIGFVPGAGTTSEVTNYEYTDNTLYTLNSQLTYYRLMQTDYDGTTDYSPVRVVELGNGNAIRVFPNPADEAVTVAFAEVTEKRGTIQLFNQSGRQVAEDVIAPGTSEHTLRVAYLPAGSYVLRVVVGSEVWTKRVVIE